MISGRLLTWASESGPRNMAIDQAILESASDSPTLRFYGWFKPTLSLGYFQSHQDREAHVASAEIEIVRRSTGGGAIVHHHELTYSLVMPHPVQVSVFGRGSTSGALPELYEQVHETVIDVLGEHGCHLSLFGRGDPPPVEMQSGASDRFLCFQRRSEWDLVAGGYKILGSAQRRVRATVLQHGSILLRASSFAPELPGIREVSSARLQAPELSERIAQELGKRWQIEWKRGSLTESEKQKSEDIQNEKFGNLAWLTRR